MLKGEKWFQCIRQQKMKKWNASPSIIYFLHIDFWVVNFEGFDGLYLYFLWLVCMNRLMGVKDYAIFIM